MTDFRLCSPAAAQVARFHFSGRLVVPLRTPKVLTRALPLWPLGLPIYVAGIPAAPFASRQRPLQPKVRSLALSGCLRSPEFPRATPRPEQYRDSTR